MKKCNHAKYNLLLYRILPTNPGGHYRDRRFAYYCPDCDIRKVYRETKSGREVLHDTISGMPYQDTVNQSDFPKRFQRERIESCILNEVESA